MKIQKLLPCLILILLLTACSKDDDCTQMDWVDTYVGTVDCDGTVEDVTIIITASGSDAVIIESETVTVTTTYEAITIDGCELNLSDSALGFSADIEAELNGNQLSISESFSGGGFDSECKYTATRQ